MKIKIKGIITSILWLLLFYLEVITLVIATPSSEPIKMPAPPAPMLMTMNEEAPTNWNFLFAIFTNVDVDLYTGWWETVHTTYTMSEKEIHLARANGRQFASFMNSTGVMKAKVDFVEIDTPITTLAEAKYGSWIDANQAYSYLKDEVNLDKYDHVFCIVDYGMCTRYLGITGGPIENGTGESCINFNHIRECPTSIFPEAVYVHEFLHFIEQQNQRWGVQFNLHNIGDSYDSFNDNGETCYRDIIANQVQKDPEFGTGVIPIVWQYPPHSFHNIEEVAITSDVTRIGWGAFKDCNTMTKVGIPESVTNIGRAAFWNTNIADVYYEGTQEEWEKIEIESFNENLTTSTIHYNGLITNTKDDKELLKETIKKSY